MYDIPFDRSFLQLSNGIRHIMSSTDRKRELKAKDIDSSDCLTAGCVLIDLASPAVSQTAVYANGLKRSRVLECLTEKIKVVQNKCWNDMREHPVTSLAVPRTLSAGVKWLESKNYPCCFCTEVKHE
jgi:hypothetical protein